MGFAKECWPFVLPCLVLAGLLAVIGQPRWAAAAAVLAVLLLLFFRIPGRSVVEQSHHILSPANGKILKLDSLADPAVGPGEYHRIVIFLSVFNVHVQRAPVRGTVTVSQYTPGRKLAAFNPRAGEVNEQQLTVIELPAGDLIGVRQIAGLLARRVVTYVDVEQRLAQGELMGVIKFGSRVDVLVPVSYHLEVEVGQRVIEGETLLARIGTETP